LLGFERTPCFCRRKIAERYTGTAKIVLLGQSTDDAPVHLAPDHSDGGALKACDIGDRGSRGCNKQYHGMCEDDDGRACDRSPTSPRTTARSVLLDENRSAASSALVVSTGLSRTRAFTAASRLASAEISLAASPSSDPTAMVSVVGRAYHRYPNSPAPTRQNEGACDRQDAQPGRQPHWGETIHFVSEPPR
jgi:hypothetical protein